MSVGRGGKLEPSGPSGPSGPKEKPDATPKETGINSRIFTIFSSVVEETHNPMVEETHNPIFQHDTEKSRSFSTPTCDVINPLQTIATELINKIESESENISENIVDIAKNYKKLRDLSLEGIVSRDQIESAYIVTLTAIQSLSVDKVLEIFFEGNKTNLQQKTVQGEATVLRKDTLQGTAETLSIDKKVNDLRAQLNKINEKLRETDKSEDIELKTKKAFFEKEIRGVLTIPTPLIDTNFHRRIFANIRPKTHQAFSNVTELLPTSLPINTFTEKTTFTDTVKKTTTSTAVFQRSPVLTDALHGYTSLKKQSDLLKKLLTCDNVKAKLALFEYSKDLCLLGISDEKQKETWLSNKRTILTSSNPEERLEAKENNKKIESKSFLGKYNNLIKNKHEWINTKDKQKKQKSLSSLEQRAIPIYNALKSMGYYEIGIDKEGIGKEGIQAKITKNNVERKETLKSLMLSSLAEHLSHASIKQMKHFKETGTISTFHMGLVRGYDKPLSKSEQLSSGWFSKESFLMEDMDAVTKELKDMTITFDSSEGNYFDNNTIHLEKKTDEDPRTPFSSGQFTLNCMFSNLSVQVATKHEGAQVEIMEAYLKDLNKLEVPKKKAKQFTAKLKILNDYFEIYKKRSAKVSKDDLIKKYGDEGYDNYKSIKSINKQQLAQHMIGLSMHAGVLTGGGCKSCKDRGGFAAWGAIIQLIDLELALSKKDPLNPKERTRLADHLPNSVSAKINSVFSGQTGYFKWGAGQSSSSNKGKKRLVLKTFKAVLLGFKSEMPIKGMSAKVFKMNCQELVKAVIKTHSFFNRT